MPMTVMVKGIPANTHRCLGLTRTKTEPMDGRSCMLHKHAEKEEKGGTYRSEREILVHREDVAERRATTYREQKDSRKTGCPNRRG